MTDEDAGYNKGANGRPVSLEAQEVEDGRRYSPSVGRNRDVVRAAFSEHMPQRGRILEIGSGTGEHGVHITAALPELIWTFTDADEASVASTKAWLEHSGRAGIDHTQALDVLAGDWGTAIEQHRFDGVFCANVIHIAPIAVAAGIFAGAGRVLNEQGRIFFYGPFAREGEMSEGNAAFDLDLKRRDRAWGVRDLEREIVPMAARAGFKLVTALDMPKNNLSVVFARG